MEREIKFKIWMPERKIMYAPKPIQYYHEANLNGPTVGEMKKWVYLQYTGLKDKNGVEIYEGDIVTDRSIVDEYGTPFRGTVGFKNMAFRFIKTNCGCGECEGIIINGEYEVLGNIHQHKHLLSAQP